MHIEKKINLKERRKLGSFGIVAGFRKHNEEIGVCKRKRNNSVV
jgi:hypothetical protein